MRLKKREKIFILMLSTVLFFGACNTEKNTIPPTPSISPTLRVENTQTPLPDFRPSGSVVPTKQPSPTQEPDAEPTLTLPPTDLPEPTKIPEPTQNEEPTSTPMPSPTKVPELTQDPVPDVAWLLQTGWQKTVDITEGYAILFPECFDESKVERTEQEILISYSSTEQTALRFVIRYTMQQTAQEALEQISDAGGIVSELSQEEKKFFYRLEGDRIEQGIVIENRFGAALLGSSFGDEEYVVGTMQILLEYPEESRAEYESEKYQYFLVPIL